MAASSVATPLEAIASDFSHAHRTSVRIAYGSSSTLARQIEGGAPAQVFVSAHPLWLDEVHRTRPIRHKRCVAGNGLALVSLDPAAANPIVDPSIKGTIAVGDPKHVPQGLYTKQALERLSVWQRLEKQLIPTPDARTSLRYLKARACAYAIVYTSDLQPTDPLTVIQRLDTELHDPIDYQAAVLPGFLEDEATQFVEFMATSTEWARHGFSPCRSR